MHLVSIKNLIKISKLMNKFLLSINILLLTTSNAYAQTNIKHNSSLPVEITADTLEVLQDKELAIFSGKVEAKQGQLNIRADKMTVHYISDDKKTKKEDDKLKQNSVSKIVTEGKVFLSAPKESAKSNSGVYDVVNQIVTLNGDVVLSSGKNILKGNKMIYDIAKGRSKMVGKEDNKSGTQKPERVRGVFIPKSK